MQQQIMNQQAQFITYNESRTAASSTTATSRGVGILPTRTGVSSSSAPSATVTPTSTPPIRVLSRGKRIDGAISPSPLTTESQKRYYEDSTWRMYDRIQASRPITLNNSMLPPTSFLSRPPANATSSFASFPRFSHRHPNEQRVEDQDEELLEMTDEPEEEELIFDLEL